MQQHMENIDSLLETNMTEKGYKFWKILETKIPPVWDRLSSSSMKYHKKEDGRVPCIAEHTYEMLNAAVKIISLFDIRIKTSEADTLLLSIVLHDAFKYGLKPENTRYTTNQHDRIVADVVKNQREIFKKLLDDNQIDLLEESLRFHSGKWSTDASPHQFNWKEHSPESLFVHVLDMLSSRNLLKY